MKHCKIILMLLFASGGAFAQSTINASGGGSTIGGNSFDYSIGEMTIVSTSSTSSLVVTQGLLQPTAQAPDATHDIIIAQNDLTIYPNPTTAIVNIKPDFKKPGTLKVTLLDANGRVIEYNEWKLESGREENQLDINHLAQGNYFLQINFNNQKNTYKIQKIK